MKYYEVRLTVPLIVEAESEEAAIADVQGELGQYILYDYNFEAREITDDATV